MQIGVKSSWHAAITTESSIKCSLALLGLNSIAQLVTSHTKQKEADEKWEGKISDFLFLNKSQRYNRCMTLLHWSKANRCDLSILLETTDNTTCCIYLHLSPPWHKNSDVQMTPCVLRFLLAFIKKDFYIQLLIWEPKYRINPKEISNNTTHIS